MMRMFPLLADLRLTNNNFILIVLGVVAVLGILAYAAYLKAKLVKARRQSQDIAAFCNEIGADDFGDFFESFAVDDVPQMAHDVAALLKIAENKEDRTVKVAKIVTKYIAAIITQKNTSEITRLQGLLGDTPEQAAAAPTAPSGVDLQSLIAALNQTNYAGQQSAGKSTITSDFGSVNVPLPKLVTQVTHSVAAPAAPAPTASQPTFQAA